MNKILQTISISLLLTLVVGCGFQPRGELPQLRAQLSPMKIQGLGISHQYRRILEDRLAVTGVSLSKTNDAITVLHIYKVKTSRKVLSVDSRNKTVEYEIGVRVDFGLKSSTGEELVARQTLSAQHILFNPGNDLLGRTQEETLLRRDMYEDLSNQLITRLQHQVK